MAGIIWNNSKYIKEYAGLRYGYYTNSRQILYISRHHCNFGVKIWYYIEYNQDLMYNSNMGSDYISDWKLQGGLIIWNYQKC